MAKIDNLRKELESILGELNGLVNFRDTPQLGKFKRQLHGEISNVKQKIDKLTETQQEKEQGHDDLINTANRTRSAKNKRTWNYIKSIQKNYFPDKSFAEIRSALKRHRQGLETDIPDVVWRNPSP